MKRISEEDEENEDDYLDDPDANDEADDFQSKKKKSTRLTQAIHETQERPISTNGIGLTLTVIVLG